MRKAIEELNRDQFNAVCNLMNDEIREQVNSEVAPCSNRRFIKHYLDLDPDFAQVLDEEFSVDPDYTYAVLIEQRHGDWFISLYDTYEQAEKERKDNPMNNDENSVTYKSTEVDYEMLNPEDISYDYRKKCLY